MTINALIKNGIFWNFLGFCSRFVLGLGSSILFVRLLGQEDYGIITFIVSCAFLTGIFLNLGLGTVVTKVLAENQPLDNKSGLLRSLLVKTSLIRGGLLLGISLLFLFSREVAELMNRAFLVPYLFLVPLIVLSSYYQGTFRTFLNACYQQKYLNLVMTLEMLVKLILVLIFLHLGYGIFGFLLALILSQAISGSQLFLRVFNQYLNGPARKTDRFNLKPHLSLARHSFLTAISIRLLGRESDLLLLGLLHPDIRQVAIYAVVFGLPNMLFEVFRSLVGGGLGLTAFTQQIKSGNLEDLRANYRQLINAFALLLFPAIIGGMVVGGDLAVFLYGWEYQGLSVPLAILFVTLGLATVNSFTADILIALNHSRWVMNCQIFFGLLNLFLNVLLIPRYGAFGVALTTGIINLSITLSLLILVHRTLKPHYPIRQLCQYLGYSLLMGLLILPFPLNFIWKIVLGVSFYLLLLLSNHQFRKLFTDLNKAMFLRIDHLIK